MKNYTLENLKRENPDYRNIVFETSNYGDEDDDKIVFNTVHHKMSPLSQNKKIEVENMRLYYWAKLEGYKKEVNGDINIGNTLRLIKKY